MSTCSNPPPQLLYTRSLSQTISHRFQIHFRRGKKNKIIGPVLSKMYPRRRSARLVVKTTKQVVKETVEVSVVQRKKRKNVKNDDEQQEPRRSTTSIETEEVNQTQKVEASVDKKPTKIIAIESQEESETPNVEQDKEPVKDVALETPQENEGATPIVEEDKELEETSTDPVDKEPVKDIAMESQQEQEESETQNFEEDSEPKETPMTPERKQENQPSKGEEEKSDDVKQTQIEEKSKNRKRKRKSREGGERYKRYVYRVLKQVHPELGMSAKAMIVLNNYMNDMFERLADEAAKLTMYTARKTLSSREIQAAVKLVLPGELGKHAMAEGTKAVSNYLSKNAGGSKTS